MPVGKEEKEFSKGVGAMPLSLPKEETLKCSEIDNGCNFFYDTRKKNPISESEKSLVESCSRKFSPSTEDTYFGSSPIKSFVCVDENNTDEENLDPNFPLRYCKKVDYNQKGRKLPLVDKNVNISSIEFSGSRIFDQLRAVDVESPVIPRVRREESIKAMEKIEKQKHRDKTPMKKVAEVPSPFYGIKNKRLHTKCLHDVSANVLIMSEETEAGKDKSQVVSSPCKKSQSQQTTPNSSCSITLSDCQDGLRSTSTKIDNTKVNSRFFLNDLEFLNSKKPKSHKKKYIKLRNKNTRYNLGYKTVDVVRKAVIEMFPAHEITWDISEKSKVVSFDTTPLTTFHNKIKVEDPKNETPSTFQRSLSVDNNIKSILLSPSIKSNFEWKESRTVVDIIRKVNLNSDRVVEDLEFVKIFENE